MSEDPVDPSDALRAAAAAAVPGWVMRCVLERCEQAGVIIDDSVVGAASVAGIAAAAQVDRELGALFATDIDQQRTNPLEVLRRATVFPSRVLAGIGLAPLERDEFAQRVFPDDVFDLSPASFADVAGSLHEPGLVWGAAKAHAHLQSRRADGQA